MNVGSGKSRIMTSFFVALLEYTKIAPAANRTHETQRSHKLPTMTRPVVSLVLSLLVLATSSSGNAFAFSAVSGHAFSKAITLGAVLPAPRAALAKRSSTSITTQLQASTSGDPVVIDSDFKLAAAFLSLGVLLDTIPWIQLTLGPLITALGVLFLVQTFRLKFVCDDKGFYLDGAGDNIVVGGENRWAYKAFVNYDFFPKGWEDQPQGPILVYFKETQTPSSSWSEGPGKSANSEEALAKGAVPGQVHFFPALCNCQQLKAEWKRRGCAKLP
jgi:hypothetical protein